MRDCAATAGRHDASGRSVPSWNLSRAWSKLWLLMKIRLPTRQVILTQHFCSEVLDNLQRFALAGSEVCPIASSVPRVLAPRRGRRLKLGMTLP